MDGSNHVEVHSVAANLESLTDVLQLDVGNSSSERVITVRVQENIGTILIQF
jgi:hypothetical protein